MKPRPTAVDPKRLCRSGVSSVPVPVPVPEERWEGSARSNIPSLVESVCEEIFYRRGHGHDVDVYLASDLWSPIVMIHRPIVLLGALGILFTGFSVASESSASRVVPENLPQGKVFVQLLEGVPAKRAWDFPTSLRVTEEYEEPAFGFVAVTKKYSDRGLVVDRSNPFLIRAFGRVKLEEGEYELLLRAFNAARIFVDGRLVAETPFPQGSTDGHEAVPELATADFPDLHRVPPGHRQTVARFEHYGGEALFRLDAFVGGKSIRREVGELFVGIGRAGPEAKASARTAPLALLSPAARTQALTEDSWLASRREPAFALPTGTASGALPREQMMTCTGRSGTSSPGSS